MTKLSNSYILSVVIKFMILLVIAKSISLALWWILPSEGVNFQERISYQPQYQKVDFKNMIVMPMQETIVQKPVERVSTGISITNMILKGLYGVGSSGIAILALKASPKNTSIVSIGELFSGFTLKAILKDSVVFTKNSTDYILKIDIEADTKQSNKSFVKAVATTQSVESEKTVPRGDINYYAKYPDKIWKDISIVQLDNNQGFQITNVRKGSKMAKLGLEKGDIMIKANNNELKSYKDAIDLYKNIDTLQTIQLVVLRNNQEKEFIYEIN